MNDRRAITSVPAFVLTVLVFERWRACYQNWKLALKRGSISFIPNRRARPTDRDHL